MIKKECIICVIIIFIIIFSQIIVNNISKKNDDMLLSEVENLKGMIKEIKDDFESKKEKDILDKINSIDKDWNKNEVMFSFFYEHDELEKVSVSLNNLKESLYSREYNDGLIYLENYKFYINHFTDKNRLKFENIF